MADKRIWVWTDIVEGAPHRLSLELLVPARKLGTAEAVILHPQGGQAVGALGAHGASVVHLGDDAAYGDYLAEPQAATLAALIEQESPDLILFPSTFT
ncbi:MAG TPA: hypothetical protein VIC60_13085, partial [Thermomicrobiales bacterium]